MAVIAVILAFTNPSKEDFSDYVANEMAKETDNTLARGLANVIAGPVVKASTYRDNYLLFSVFSFNDGSSDIKVVGLLNGIFFSL